MFWMILVGLIVLGILGWIIYTMPSESTTKAKKKVKELKSQVASDSAAKLEASRDWKVIAERWEKQNNNLIGELEKIKMHQKDLEKQISSQKDHDKNLVDKLSQEKSWREKEQVNLDKAKANEKELKAQLIRTESDLEKEHSSRIRLEQQIAELKSKLDVSQDEKRASNTKANSLETTLLQANKDLKELRDQNKELSKRKADIQWVAKSDYDELNKKLKAKEQELAQLKTPPTA
ncbi:MAG: hypothetical protein HQL15_03930 [Candidatus Omnitrophica bacterium]|nr:hypothetical protein [Candidatus Omnitrophota bacterium]